VDRRSTSEVGAEDLPFRQIAQHLPTPCWISDRDGLIIWVNDAWVDYTGMTVEAIQKQGLKGIHDPAVYPDVVAKWEQVKTAGEADEMVFPLRDKDGRFRPFHTRVVPIRDHRGRVERWFGTNTDVSAQTAAEARLRSSEEQLREVFDRAGDAIFVSDAEGRLIHVNAAACAMGRYSQDELLAMSVWDLVDQGEQTALVQARQQQTSIRDWRIRRKDGSFIPVEVSSRKLSDGRRIGVARDVSARRQAEEAERQALNDFASAQAARASDLERRLHRFWDSSRDLFAVVSGLDGTAQLINEKAWMQTLGFGADRVIGRRLLDLVHPEDRERTLAKRQAEPGDAAYYGFENRYLRADGSVAWLSWNVVRDGDLIYCNARDITEEKLAREELARSEGQFRMLVAGVVDYALFMLSPGGIVTNWNAGAERIKGYAADEIIGRHVSTFYTEADRAAGLPQAALATAAEQGRFECESWRMRKDGSLFWANVVLDAIRDDAGQLVGFAKVTRDITERRNSQLDLQKANARLAQAQKMEALGQLTGGVAHDFNNLLMVTGGQAELLRDRVGGDPACLRSLDAITAATKRGQALTRHLLAFARRQRLNPAPVALAARVTELQALLASSLGSMVAIGIDCPADLWTVEVDVSELELAILNMAVNARDAMSNGGRFTIAARNVTVGRDEADPERRGDFVEVRISDSGVGIPLDILPKVFDPFFTTKDASKGTGLGLSQVYGFVQQSGGRVEVESELGQGTTIRIQLPRADARPVHTAVAAPKPPSGRLDVLCVEDNADVADVAVGLLQHLGHRARAVNSAAAALGALEAGPPPDLVFSDIVMAGEMDGLALAREIRGRWPAMPVLLATGYSRRAEAIGAEFPILAKPYQIGQLVDAIGAVMQAAAEPRA
jgi:PAS domain S-box-containing protein